LHIFRSDDGVVTEEGLQSNKFLRIEARPFQLAHPEAVATAGTGDELTQRFDDPLQFIGANRFVPQVFGYRFHDIVKTIDIGGRQLALRTDITTRFQINRPAVYDLRTITCALLGAKNFK